MSAKYLNLSGTNQPFRPVDYVRFPLGRKPAAKDRWLLLLTEAEAEVLFQGGFSPPDRSAEVGPRLVEFPEAHEDFLL